MGNTKFKPFPHPGVYVFYPPMHAYVVRVHRGGYWCAIKTISDVWGNGFVGIAPPEYIRDVRCAQAPDPTRPPREPRSARRFWTDLGEPREKEKAENPPNPLAMKKRIPSPAGKAGHRHFCCAWYARGNQLPAPGTPALRTACTCAPLFCLHTTPPQPMSLDRAAFGSDRTHTARIVMIQCLEGESSAAGQHRGPCRDLNELGAEQHRAPCLLPVVLPLACFAE